MRVTRYTFVFFIITMLFGAAHPTSAQGLIRPISKPAVSGASKSPTIILIAKDGSVAYRTATVNGPCDTAAPIVYGQTIAGTLSNQDCQLEDGTWADFYQFQGNANDRITIDLVSSQFDAYLGLAMLNTTFSVEDDDSGGGTNARIQLLLPMTGTYIILANAVFPNTFGAYSLSLTLSPTCTYAIQPTTAEVPASGGVFTVQVSTAPYCQWYSQSNSAPDLIINPNNGNGSGPGPNTVFYSVTPNDTGATRTLTATIAGQTFTVTQAALDCTLTVSPESFDLPGAQTSASATVSINPGCRWSAFNNDFFIWIDSPNPHTGPGSFNFHVTANNGAARTGSIRIGNRTIVVRQAGLNCTYSVSPAEMWVSALETVGTLTITTQPDCSLLSSNGYVTIPGNAGTGTKTLQYTVAANQTFSPVVTTHHLATGVGNIPVVFHQASRASLRRFDYDGDARADVSVRRPSTGTWYFRNSASGFTAMTWGEPGDKMTPADFDGDGKTDIAVFRPSSGSWYVVNSSDLSFAVYHWGQEGDVPVPSERNGDGKADLVIYRPGTGVWYSMSTITGPFGETQFGEQGDKPMIGDFDGDGRGDLALYRPTNNNWYLIKSSGGYYVQTWGETGDIPVAADMDGDAKTDLAVFRPSTGQWFLSMNSMGFAVSNWGEAGDVPVPADYDGDGKADIAVYRPSDRTWYIVMSASGLYQTQFGESGDVPTEAAYND